VLKAQTYSPDPSHPPLAYDYFSGILKVTSLLLPQECCATETPFEEILMLLSQQVLCVVSSFPIITVASPTAARDGLSQSHRGRDGGEK